MIREMNISMNESKAKVLQLFPISVFQSKIDINEDTKKFLDQAKRDDRTVVEHKIYYDFV